MSCSPTFSSSGMHGTQSTVCSPQMLIVQWVLPGLSSVSMSWLKTEKVSWFFLSPEFQSESKHKFLSPENLHGVFLVPLFHHVSQNMENYQDSQTLKLQFFYMSSKLGAQTRDGVTKVSWMGRNGSLQWNSVQPKLYTVLLWKKNHKEKLKKQMVDFFFSSTVG